jgi:tetratricopeptide (TPR) repeat protein
VGLLVLLAAVAVTVVVTRSGTRLPGETETGSVKLSRAAQLGRTLAQAETFEARGNAPDAVRLYEQVLTQDPTQPDALAQLGWLEFEAGAAAHDTAVLERAQQLEEAAQRVEPGAYAPHLYLGSMLLAEGDDTGAVGQYRQFLADGPPPAEVRTAQPFIAEAFKRAHQPLPALPGATTPTPSATTTPAAG